MTMVNASEPCPDCGSTKHKACSLHENLIFIPNEHHDIADLANIGYAFIVALAKLFPNFEWNESPAEFVLKIKQKIESEPI